MKYVVMKVIRFTAEMIEEAFQRAGAKCECCHKELSFKHSRKDPGRGQWEPHHGGRLAPVILCTGEPENCHLNCGHDGDYHNPGVTPRVHKGGGYCR